MKAKLFFLLFSYALLATACASSTAVGMSPDVPAATVAQPTPAKTPDAIATSVFTATVEPAATAEPAPTAEPVVTETSTATATPEATETAQPTIPTGPAEAIDSEQLELGKEVYRHQACGVCHVLASVGTLGAFGPPHDDLATIAAERIHEERYSGNATTAAEYIRESIVDPQAFFVEGYQITRFPMPIFTNLSEQQVDALVYLLMQPPAINP